MKETGRLMLAMAILLLASAASAGVSVKWQEETDFSGYRSFAWKKGAPALQERVQAEIVRMVNRELEAKGLSEVEGEADLHVMTYAYGEGEANTSVDLGYFGRTDGFGVPTASTRVNTAGTLMVRLVDAGTDAPVWEGRADKTLGENVSKALKKIDKMIGKMFEQFPP